MQGNNQSSLSRFLSEWKSNEKYFEILGIVSKLTRLFSVSDVPYLDYRLAENIFCKYFKAINDARSCTAYDARVFKNVGIGIKTFTLGNNDSSLEKIAEFNKLSKELKTLKGFDLARRIANFRNERMQYANNTFDITESQYHIIGRKSGILRIFNSPYDEIRIDEIRDVKDNNTSISFNDGQHEYRFNKSKSVLQKRFYLSQDFRDVPIDIIENPLDILENLFKNIPSNVVKTSIYKTKGTDYVILPLYSTKKREVLPKSGLNQWNAGGRKRDENEVYISIPIKIHKYYPNFFPARDVPFELILPDGKSLQAKVCQENCKALMSNPNSALGEWILRKVLNKSPGQLVTMRDLDIFGVDSVLIEKRHQINENGQEIFSIAFNCSYENYSDFIENED